MIFYPDDLSLTVLLLNHTEIFQEITKNEKFSVILSCFNIIA